MSQQSVRQAARRSAWGTAIRRAVETADAQPPSQTLGSSPGRTAP
jgi:hypothetical protein